MNNSVLSSTGSTATAWSVKSYLVSALVTVFAFSYNGLCTASVTSDRFGGLEDCYSYGEGAGKAAPALARAYEALVIAQMPSSMRKTPPVFPAGSANAEASPAQEGRRGFEGVRLRLADFQAAATECRNRIDASLPYQKDPFGLNEGTELRDSKQTFGPFPVPWGKWTRTGVAIKKGQRFTISAKGAYVSRNQNTDVKTCGPNGCGHWVWFVLKAKIGSQIIDVGASGGGTANADGMIELGSPRVYEFVKEDAQNCIGALSVRVMIGPR